MEEEKNQTIETITKSYEEKIANREKEVLKEKEQIKNEMKVEFEKEKQELIEKHNKEIADIILGREDAKKVQQKENENDNLSFFDKVLQGTKKKLGIKEEN